jgi:hypothetical protein
MDQVLAEAKVEISPSSKVWEPQRAYEKRLSTIQAKENRKSLVPYLLPDIHLPRQLKHPRRRGRRKRVLLQLRQAVKRKAKQNGHKTKVPQLLRVPNRGELRGRIRMLIPRRKAQATNMLQSLPKLDLAQNQRQPLVTNHRRRLRKLTWLNHHNLARLWRPLHHRKVQRKVQRKLKKPRRRSPRSNVQGQTMMMKSHPTEQRTVKLKESLISKSEESEFGTEQSFHFLFYDYFLFLNFLLFCNLAVFSFFYFTSYLCFRCTRFLIVSN